jgi:hypothetical protein
MGRGSVDLICPEVRDAVFWTKDGPLDPATKHHEPEADAVCYLLELEIGLPGDPGTGTFRVHVMTIKYLQALDKPYFGINTLILPSFDEAAMWNRLNEVVAACAGSTPEFVWESLQIAFAYERAPDPERGLPESFGNWPPLTS